MIRTPYFQSLMESTKEIANEAIQKGFTGAWERRISQALEMDYLKGHSEAVELINQVYREGEPPPKAYLRAAYLITSSKIQKHETASNI